MIANCTTLNGKAHETLERLAGINCNPFFLQAVVECRIFGWKTFGTPVDGVCYTTGRFRLTITE